jgi:Domain of unknown function (DUF4178)
MSLAPVRAGTCPSCGAPLAFKIGSARAAVCAYCKSLVARRGQAFELVGKVADLVPTGTSLRLGASGHFGRAPFTLAGRVQLEWTQGVWDEWYAVFADGRSGWLAAAQGRYYMTFPEPGVSAPPEDRMAPGFAVMLGTLGRFVVTDVKHPKVVSCEGELPDVIALGQEPTVVDAEGEGGAFATIDYGASPGDPHEIFIGRQVALENLEIQGGAAEAEAPERPEAESLKCPNCNAPLTLHVAEQTVRYACPSCDALLDARGGSLRLLTILARHRTEPPIPLGTKGKLRGAELVIIGWMRRICMVDGVTYPWEELLAYEPKTTEMCWLVRSDGHWQLGRSIPAGEVDEGGKTALYKGRSYSHFSSVTGKVDEVLGEFPWAVRAGEQAKLDDYVDAPEGISSERSTGELVWTHMTHLEPKEVAEAFGVPDLAAENRIGVGPVQPWPYSEVWRSIKLWMGAGLAAVLLLFLVFLAMGNKTAYSHDFTSADIAAPEPPAEGDSTPPDPHVHTFLSEPFQLSGGQAVEIELQTDVSNSWAYADVGLIDDASGEVQVLGLESSYYFGTSDGESWSEGSRTASESLSAPHAGTYLLRAEVQWDPARAAPPAMTLAVREGGFSLWQLIAVLLVIGSPALLVLHRLSWETRRLKGSNLVPQSSGDSD